jgi:pimeloyl-ACP methyl ester carboxylesterase
VSTFLEIRNVVAKECHVDKLKSPVVDGNKFMLTAMYFAQLVYFKWDFVERSLKTLPGYVSHEFFDADGTEAFFVEFEKHVFVSFRGTQQNFRDVSTIARFWQRAFVKSKTHQGFSVALDKVYDGVLERIKQAEQNGKDVHYTGHSMGAALATLMAIRHKPKTAIVFASPRALTGKFYQHYFSTFEFLRVETKWDIVTKIPFSIPFFVTYKHVGPNLVLYRKFKIIHNHFIKAYIRSVLDQYYAVSAGFEEDISISNLHKY